MTNYELLRKYDALVECHNWIYVECKKTGERYIASFKFNAQIDLTHADHSQSIVIKDEEFDRDYIIRRITSHSGDKCYYEGGKI